MGQPVKVDIEGRMGRRRPTRRALRWGRATVAGLLPGYLLAALLGAQGPDTRLAGARLAQATPPAQVLDASAIRAQQNNLVAANHQAPLGVARFAVDELTATTQRDGQAVAGDQRDEATARARSAAATERLGGDQAVLTAATAARTAADLRLAGDRAQLRQIALGMYTGALTNPQPDSLRALEADQARIIDAAEVEVVAGVVGSHLHADLVTSAVDARQEKTAASQVASDRATAAQEADAARAAASRTLADKQTLASDQSRLDAAGRRLSQAEAELAADLTSVAGPPSVAPGQLSILGGSALTAKQLTGWFTSQGYVDLTSAPVDQLAAWYLEAGSQEGVRGDVAFAQAVLETGGFGSPDAVSLSNFAGIGHCDTCGAGWGFPSPQGGVLGQMQLLRIFADAGPGPASAPAPVLADLTPSRQGKAGCCSTVEALTGVWATDPTYAQQILDIYGQMLSYALSGSSAT